MDKTELQEKVLLGLLINRHSGEEVNADLIKRVTEEFASIAKEMKPSPKGTPPDPDRLGRLSL